MQNWATTSFLLSDGRRGKVTQPLGGRDLDMTSVTKSAPPADGGNRRVFAGTEFDLWAYREELEPGEKFLFESFLHPDGKTLEAGCGGGRLVLDLQRRGFRSLHGFDYLAEFVEIARSRDVRKNIDFQVQNAIRLDYPDCSFDQAIYVQQVLCFLEDPEDRRRAVQEIHRVLRPGGVALISLLSFRSRAESPAYRLLLAYLWFLRKLTFRSRSLQQLPWLRRSDAINAGALLDRGPYMYWFHDAEAVDLFTNAGLEITQLGTDAQVRSRLFFTSLDELRQAPYSGRLYLIARKPA